MNKELILRALNAYRSHKSQNLKNAIKYGRNEIAEKTAFQIIEIENDIKIVENETSI